MGDVSGMRPSWLRWVSQMLLASFVTSLAGCYSYESIKPAEVPKLDPSSGGSDQRPRSSDDAQVVRVETPDGRIVEVNRQFNLRLTLRNGNVLEFERPVEIAVQGETLSIAGGNRARATIELHDITQAEVSQFDGSSTAAAIVLPIILVGGIGLAATAVKNR